MVGLLYPLIVPVATLDNVPPTVINSPRPMLVLEQLNVPAFPVIATLDKASGVLVPATKKLSDVLLVVTKNYGQYNECSIRVDSWIEWYNQQKKIFDSVK